jgi:hypothetical protein
LLNAWNLPYHRLRSRVVMLWEEASLIRKFR